MRNPNDFEDLDTFAAAVQAEAVADVHRSDFEWAIGDTAPNERHLEVEYGIEPSRGDGTREISDELYDAVHGLPDYRDGARIVTRTVTYGPWRYVTPAEIDRGDANHA